MAPETQPCPECEVGHVVERRSRQAKVFWACSRFPHCQFTSPARPLPQTCPTCSSPYLVEKLVRQVSWAFCPNRSCTYKSRITPFF